MGARFFLETQTPPWQGAGRRDKGALQILLSSLRFPPGPETFKPLCAVLSPAPSLLVRLVTALYPLGSGL